VKFESQYLQQWPDDKEYEFYLEAWLVYRRAADAIDGHIKYPKNAEEQSTVSRAGREACIAQYDFMKSRGFDFRDRNAEKWQRAKMESLSLREKLDSGIESAK
jgi:hypothetical protein